MHQVRCSPKTFSALKDVSPLGFRATNIDRSSFRCRLALLAHYLLADIWSQVLNRPNVESGDDFFALGGDSLRGLQVVARVRGVRGLDAPRIHRYSHRFHGN